MGNYSGKYKNSINNSSLTQYLRFDGSSISIKSDTFSLSTTGILIDSSTPEIGVGATDYLGEGIWLGYDSEGMIYTAMTSNVLPAGQRAFDADENSTAYYVFDSSTGTYINYSVGEWVVLELPRKKTLAKYRLYTTSTYFATAWKVQGSIDAITWTDLDTRSSITAASGWSSYYTLSSPDAYKYYRFYVTTVNAGGYARIYSIDYSDVSSYRFSSVGSASTGNSFIWDGEALSIKGDLYVGSGENGIYFEDSKIFLGDNIIDYGVSNNHYIRYVANLPVADYPNIIISSLGFSIDSETAPTEFTTSRTFQNRFYNYSTPTYFNEYLEQDEYTAFYHFYTSSSVSMASYLTVGPLTASDDDSMYINTPMPIEYMIPEWYGTTTAITKYPDISAWTDPEDCPISNIWVWRKSVGTPSRVVYFRLPDGNIWWVNTTEL
jgi:hypothetical protein